jgi:hypothetical protein
VFLPGVGVSHLEFSMSCVAYTDFLERLGSFARVIVFEKRGNGSPTAYRGSKP